MFNSDFNSHVNKRVICGVSVVVNPEMEEKMARLESLLLNDLSVFKHRQVIHPVLQEGEFIFNTYGKSTELYTVCLICCVGLQLA